MKKATKKKKKAAGEEAQDVAETDSVEELPAKDGAVETPEAVEATPAPAPGRKSLGTKEVIPFRWKLVGRSGNYVLTLFKAVEREDVEAQYERLKRDGYYTDIEILDVDHKIEQPKPEPPPKEKKRKGAAKGTGSSKAKSGGAATATAESSSAPAAKRSRAGAKKATAKTTKSRSTGKKAPAKSAKRRASRKKS